MVSKVRYLPVSPLEVEVCDAGGGGAERHLPQQLVQGGERVAAELRVQLQQVPRLGYTATCTPAYIVTSVPVLTPAGYPWTRLRPRPPSFPITPHPNFLASPSLLPPPPRPPSHLSHLSG
jgi:hypothetical protein